MGPQEVSAGLHGPAPGPAVEAEIARDLVRRGGLVAPAVLVVAGLVSGWEGVAGAAAALGLVCANFALGTALLTWAGRISVNALLVVSVTGFFVRLALVTAVGLALRTQDWFAFGAFGVVLIAAHLGLLFWELRSVSLTLAHPGLRPAKE